MGLTAAIVAQLAVAVWVIVLSPLAAITRPPRR